MRTKLVWTFISMLLVGLLVLSACQTTTPTPQPTTVTGSVKPGATTPTTTAPTTKPTTVAPTTPQYGGDIAFIVSQTGGFDPANVMNFFPSWCLIYDALVVEDWTKGPSGNGSIPLASNWTAPTSFVGWLAESWEVKDLKNIIYHVRQGVKFWNKPPVNGRELTADDIVFNFERDKKEAKSSWYNAKATVKKIDKYTVQFTYDDNNLEIVKSGYSNFVIGAPEIANTYGDMTDWTKVVGTGPYMIKDVVPESSITFTRNPGYFATDPLNPKNQLPYISTLKALVIIDVSTQDAALRTGKVAELGVPLERAKALLKTNPDLKQRRVFPGNTYIAHMRTDIKDSPLAQTKVRQALSMAINRDEVVKGLYLGDATIMQWPFQPSAGPAYTPLEELPANLKKLYEYRPDDAKKLLAEAGYPTGFKLTVTMLTGTYAGGTDLYSVIKTYWDAIGVQTTLQPVDATTYWSQVVGHTYSQMSVSAWGNSSPYGGLVANYGGYLYNYSVVNDEKINTAYTDIINTVNDVERFKKMKDIGLYMIEQQYYINMPTPYGYVLWQPWFKGYNGEVAWGTLNGWYGMLRFAWIDQALKDKMND